MQWIQISVAVDFSHKILVGNDLLEAWDFCV